MSRANYFKKECEEGFLILFGEPKKSEKAYVIGIAYNKKDADIFVEALKEHGDGVPESDDSLLEEDEEPVTDLVDELSSGLRFPVGASDYDDEWSR